MTDPKPSVAVKVQVTKRQLDLLNHPATVLWIGTGTKTGKTVACGLWIVQGILAGEPTAWCGPFTAKTRKAYDMIKAMLKPLIDSGSIRSNDTLMSLDGRHAGLGTLSPFTGDNAPAIYGDAYKRFVIDEASRQKEASLTAALTTVSATGGKVRLAFNVELGVKNWAIRNLLRVRGMSSEDRKAASEDFMLFPTGGEGFVDPKFIELMRTKMPDVMWRALYLAEIPEEDVSLFRNLDKVFSGPKPPEGPVRGKVYLGGLDLARKRNYTVATVGDTEGRLVGTLRFHELSWSAQYERAVAFFKHWKCVKVWVDQSGLGDPVVDELQKRGLSIEGVVFTRANRNPLLEKLMVACDNVELQGPDPTQAPEFEPYVSELSAMELVLKESGAATYEVPAGFNDDCIFSLALYNQGRVSGNLGHLLYRVADEQVYSRGSLSAY